MILTCPNCSTRFNFSKEGLGETGVKVRCTECFEVWHQNPVDEDDIPVQDDINDGETETETESETESENLDSGDGLEMAGDKSEMQDSIDNLLDNTDGPDENAENPENKEEEPLLDETNISEAEENQGKNDHKSTENKENEDKAKLAQGKIPDKRVVSFGAAGAVFLLFFIILLIIRNPLMSSYPSMHGFYSLLGLGMEVPGKGLVFDKVTSAMTKNELHIKGKIVNLSNEERDIPLIEASIRDKDHHPKEIWHIVVPEGSIAGEEEMNFTSVYHVKEPIKDDFKKNNDIHFRFVMKKPDADMSSDGEHAEKGHGEDDKHDVEHSANDTGHETKEHHGEDTHPKEDSHHSKTDEAGDDNIPAHH